MMSGVEKNLLRVLMLAVILAVTLFVHAGVSRTERAADDITEDIWYEWGQGQLLIAGKNPYEQVLQADMWGPNPDDRVATYLPLWYLVNALSQKAMGQEALVPEEKRPAFQRWLRLWRFVFVLADVGVAALLIGAFHRRRQGLAAVTAAAFWFFSRWTLHVALIGHVDFAPIFLMVLSLLLFEKRPWLALVLFGVSLALKQIAVFMAPLYVIWMWQSASEWRWRRAFLGALALAAIPVLVSLPFIVLNAEAFFKSILFSATRTGDASGHFSAESIDDALGLRGPLGRLPLLVMLALVYACAIRQQVGRYVAALLAMAVFTGFNALLFRQYLCWVVPLVPLMALDGSPTKATARGRAKPRVAGESAESRL